MRTALLCTGIAAAAAGLWLGHEHRARSAVATTVIPGAAECGPALAESQYREMVFVPGGSFIMGADVAFPEEGPATEQTVAEFWIDRTEVTNAQFAEFVAATGYRTLAELGVRMTSARDATAVAGSAVFRPDSSGPPARGLEPWWRFVPGANWREPEGPGSSIEGKEAYPVVHVAWDDAAAYAAWKGRSLPTETQFEFAARTSARKNAAGHHTANTWQGIFPARNEPADGHTGAAPVACYEPNALGLYDMIGNVWEWTASVYYPRHDFAAKREHPHGHDPNQPGEAVAVLKGGSYLCAPDYCMRYRPEARIGFGKELAASHIGFRTVLNP